MVGTTLSHFKVLEKIGEGGMGEVYRAEDTNLSREVAIKVLPKQFTQDLERLVRFEREAKLLASLNHPNIAAIYSFEHSEDVHFLVLELVEGETLAERVAKGPLPVEEALEVCRQIAEGVEAAHEKGIIHRDLKPANVKVTPEGKVKVLDFGLAKAFEGETPATDTSQSPTLIEGMTRAGVILGTVGYMSPEQARGKPVDQRADIFAFGCILYECLTGKRLFDGPTASDTLASVLTMEPDWGLLPDDAPPPIRRLLRRCLDKDIRERLPHIGAARLDIRDALISPSSEGMEAVEVSRHQPLKWAITGLAVGALVVAIAAAIAGWQVARSGAATPVPLQRFSIDLPEETILPTGVGTDIAISPDGQSLVYVADGASGKRLYLRRLDELVATPIPGTEGTSAPFFSPDGQWVAFAGPAPSQLKRVSLSGGESFAICDPCDEASWGDDGSIVFNWEGSLWRIPEVGSSPELLANPMPDRGVPAMIRPVLLPGGQAVLFEIGIIQFGGVGVLSLENNELIVVSTDGSDPLYSSTGHILFARGNTLFAIPFDVEKFEVTEPAVPVLQGVRVENGGALQADVSRDGLLVYAPAGAAMGTQLVWVDREGQVESVLDNQWRIFYAPRISPDGKQVAVQINEGGGTDVWIHESGTMRLLTTDGVSANPIWTPDGSGVAFTSGSAGSFAIQWTIADGTSEVKTLLPSEYPVFPAAWSPEGNQLVFQEDSPKSNLFVADVGDGGSRTAFLETDFSEHSATLSHSGKWLAYVSNRSGSDEVYVRPFPGPGAEQVISRGGAKAPVWGPDDTELFYRSSDRALLRVASLQSEPFQVLSREVVFATRRFWGAPFFAHYDIHPDGQRFLMMNMQGSEGARPRIHVVLNWFEELERLVPTN